MIAWSNDASEKFEALKREYIAERGEAAYSMDMLRDERIWNTKLYDLCRKLPKGADLHIHGTCLLPVRELIAFLRTRDEWVVNVSKGEERGILSPSISAGEDCMTVGEALASGEMTEDELCRLWTLEGSVNPDPWVYFEGLFNKSTALGTTPMCIEAYYVRCFEYCVEHNILHLEIRVLLFGGHEQAEEVVMALRNAYYAVRAKEPDFRVRLVGCGLKFKTLDMALTETLIENSMHAHRAVLDDFDPAHPAYFLHAVDLVNEEDKSRPLSEFAELMGKVRRECPEMAIYLHAGESCILPGDNIETAMACGALRIGHGFSLYRFPELKEAVKAKGVCLEVCPISNQTLGYVDDMRSHPAAGYWKEGVPMVLCSDDPAFQEHATLTDDYFAAIVAWELSLADVMQLSENAIRYSGLGTEDKKSLLAALEARWQEWVKLL